MDDNISRADLISALNDIAQTYSTGSFVRDVLEYVVDVVKSAPAVVDK